ncbi:MAG: hypothetical protein HGA33_04830 [Candidatus Moranbacteria bacterium]|nr:hypothetical protein [Candidatus Moranbacteria bacterium]
MRIIRRKYAWVFLVPLFLFVLLPNPSFAADGFTYTPLEPIPGSEDAAKLPEYITAIYKFALWAVGIAAMFMITIGGAMYLTSAGNTSALGNAKGVITDAIIGLVLALAAWFLLNLINPDILNGDLSIFSIVGGDTLSTVGGGTGTDAGTTALTTSGGACTGANSGCCKAGTKCADCQGCVSFTNSYANLCYKGAMGNTGCMLSSTLAGKLNAANLDSVNAEVSEAWPPTVIHSEPCHANGTCADVRCKSGCANASVASIKAIYDALKNAGLNPVFESYAANCPTYTAAGITCISPSTMTAPSFHVNP